MTAAMRAKKNARRRAEEAAKKAEEKGAKATDHMPTHSNHIQVCCGTGATRLAQLPTEDAMALRHQELQDFADKCKGKDIGWWMRTNSMNSACPNCGDEDAFSTHHFRAFIFHLFAGTEVNGEDGQWCNGMFGSRWNDFTWSGKTIRYAYYHPDSDANNKTGKEHIYQMWE